MTDKLLFYIDSYFVHFGIAKSIQEKYDCDLYGIIDVDVKAKPFFENQQMVNFKKIWHYLEHTSRKNKKPDYNYLKSFEEKYKINLWQIAYTDKYFFKYNSHYKFQKDEVLSIIEQECTLFEQILEQVKPDFLVMLVPISHYQELLYQMCRSLGIKVMMLLTPKFAGRMLISENPVVVDKQEYHESSMSEDELLNYMKEFDMFKQLNQVKKMAFESNKWERYKSILKYFLTLDDKDHKNRYSNFGINRYVVFKEKITRSIKRKTRKSFIDKNFEENSNDSSPFIYFPLHYEPERILLIDAPFYDNQLSVITNVAKSIPVGYTLILKEHPFMQTVGWRPLSFYKELINLPNVKILHPSTDPMELIKKCDLVVTIAGTTGLEAAFYEKPTVILSDQLYSETPFTYRIQNLEELPKIIRKALQNKVNLSDLGKFVKMMDENTFELSFFKITTAFAYKFGFKGPMIDAELPISEVESFLNDFKSEFNLLGEEHIKKILYHNQNKIN
jgi:hypothetical protein